MIITVRDGRIQGSVNALQDGFYQLRATRDGGQLVVQVEGEPPPDKVAIPPTSGDPVLPNEAPGAAAAQQQAAQIDMLVVYTPAARRSVGNIAGGIDLSIAQTNNALYRSGINGRLRLVRSAEVAYDEGGLADCDAVLGHLTDRADGHMDQVHAMRTASGADLVALLVDAGADADCGGIAWVLDSNSPDMRIWGFSVTVAKWANAPDYIFAHEIGHNLGAGHDTYVDPGRAGLYSYSHGYVSVSGGWRTVMAYYQECMDAGVDCPSIVEYSDPSRGTGKTRADNARTLRQTVATVASYYGGTAPTPTLGKPKGLEPRYAIADNPPVFRWREASGPVFKYELAVQENGSNRVVLKKHVSPTGCLGGAPNQTCTFVPNARLSVRPLPERYSWWVRAQGSDDKYGKWSTRRSFYVPRP